MKITVRRLQSLCPAVPTDVHALRGLLDDLGLEVKRVDRFEDDHVLTLELLANRGDHRCYEGVAREVAARTGTIVAPLALAFVVERSGDPAALAVTAAFGVVSLVCLLAIRRPKT